MKEMMIRLLGADIVLQLLPPHRDGDLVTVYGHSGGLGVAVSVVATAGQELTKLWQVSYLVDGGHGYIVSAASKSLDEAIRSFEDRLRPLLVMLGMVR